MGRTFSFWCKMPTAYQIAIKIPILWENKSKSIYFNLLFFNFFSFKIMARDAKLELDNARFLCYDGCTILTLSSRCVKGAIKLMFSSPG